MWTLIWNVKATRLSHVSKCFLFAINLLSLTRYQHLLKPAYRPRSSLYMSQYPRQDLTLLGVPRLRDFVGAFRLYEILTMTNSVAAAPDGHWQG